MDNRYMGELTFNQLWRVIKRCWLKSLICMTIVFIILFIASIIAYMTGIKSYYRASFTYGEQVDDYYTETDNIKNPNMIEGVLLKLGYSESYIDESLLNDICQNLVISAIVPDNITDESSYVPNKFTVQLNGVNGDLSDNEYNQILDGILNEYTKNYRSKNTIGTNTELSEFDYSSQEYIYGIKLINVKYDTVLSSVNYVINNTEAASYICEENGKTFNDIANRLTEIKVLIDEYELYVESNALVKGNAIISVHEYLKKELETAESDYEKILFEYEALLDSYNKVAENGGFGNVDIDLENNKITSTLSEDFYELIKEIKSYAKEVASAKETLNQLRIKWEKFGGLISYDSEGKATYSVKENIPACDSAKCDKADEMFLGIQEELKEQIEYFNEIAAEYNNNKLGMKLVYISLPSHKQTESSLNVKYLVILNVAGVLIAFAVVNIITYRKMKQNGEFIVEVKSYTEEEN